MGRSPCCSRVGLRRGPWSAKEDTLLASYIQLHGEGQWRSLPKKAGLLRCGKSCRLRWMNYLRPGIKRGNISEDEEDLIVRLHGLLGNRWSLIAGRLPGRTDNEIKNYWNTHLLKKMKINNRKPTSTATAAAPVKKRKSQKKADKSTVAAEAKKDNNNNNDDGKMEGEEMKSTTKVYLPKPLRVSSALPRTESYDSFASGSSSSEGAAAEVLVSAWPTPPVFEIEDPALLYLYSGDDNMWEKVYAEYMQLL